MSNNGERQEEKKLRGKKSSEKGLAPLRTVKTERFLRCLERKNRRIPRKEKKTISPARLFLRKRSPRKREERKPKGKSVEMRIERGTV